MDKPFVVGIAGGSGSGKSWLANRICERLEGKSVVLRQDWYYRDLSGMPEDQAAETNFDHPSSIEVSLMEAHLKQLIEGRTINSPRYRFSNFARSKESVRTQPAPIILVEGLHTLWFPGIRALLDDAIFVDCPQNTRFARRLKRDLRERGYARSWIAEMWQSRTLPMHRQFVEPTRRYANAIWQSSEEESSVDSIVARLAKRA